MIGTKIGEKIREYRLKKGITQEGLAAELHVSSQAVSKWETGQTTPDITLLLPMSHLLGVGVNELLGGARRDELDREWQNAKAFGDELALLAAENALKEFPDDEEFLFRRAEAEYDLGIKYKKSKALASGYLGQARDHFAELRERFPENDNYTVRLAEAYFAHGNREHALELAYSLKSSSKQKNLIAKCLGGEAEIRFKQSKLEGQVKNVYNSLIDLGTRESIDAAHALLDVMMGEGKAARSNYLWSLSLTDAELCLDEGDLDGYAEKFAMAYEAMKAYDALPRSPIAYADPLFNRLQNEKNRSLDKLHFFDRFLSSEKLGHPSSLALRRKIADENVECGPLWRHEWIAFYQFCCHSLCHDSVTQFATLYNFGSDTEELMKLFGKHGSNRMHECFYQRGKESLEELIGGGKMRGFAARIGNRIVGYCNAWDKTSYVALPLPTEHRDAPAGEKILFFANIYTEKNLDGCGVDERLIATALDWAYNNEYPKAEVYLCDNDTAKFDRDLALYEKFGFGISHDLTEDGRRKYIMEKELDTLSPTRFKQFEREVMALIAKEKPEYEAKIMAQYDKARVTGREFTGRGFFTDFEVADPADSFGDGIKEPFGSISVNFPSLKYGAGFVLFVKNGFITMLEGYTYGNEPWPDRITDYKVIQPMKTLIKSIIDKHDPMGLLSGGAPDDEYQPEINRLAQLVRADMTQNELSTVIYDLFLDMFSEPIDRGLCDKMAQEILENL